MRASFQLTSVSDFDILAGPLGFPNSTGASVGFPSAKRLLAVVELKSNVGAKDLPRG